MDASVNRKTLIRYLEQMTAWYSRNEISTNETQNDTLKNTKLMRQDDSGGETYRLPHFQRLRTDGMNNQNTSDKKATDKGASPDGEDSEPVGASRFN